MEVWPVTAKRGPDAGAIRAVARAARDAGVDVMHCHGYKANILGGLFGRPAFQGPTVTTLHGWTTTTPLQTRWWYSVIERHLLTRFSAVVAVQPGMLTDGRLPRSVRRRLTVIENGIDVESSEQSAADDQRTAPAVEALRSFCARRATIGVIGRLSAEKGVEVLLDAFARVRKAGVDVQLAVIGDGPLMSELRNQAAQLELGEAVHFSGFVPAASAILPALALLVIPSHSEGLPMVMLEAMRARRPIVATSVGGIPQALRDGDAGRLVAPGDAHALAAAIETVLRDRELAARYCDAAFREFARRFNVNAMVDRYVSLYERVRDE